MNYKLDIKVYNIKKTPYYNSPQIFIRAYFLEGFNRNTFCLHQVEVLANLIMENMKHG